MELHFHGAITVAECRVRCARTIRTFPPPSVEMCSPLRSLGSSVIQNKSQERKVLRTSADL